jgi:putative membrane protein
MAMNAPRPLLIEAEGPAPSPAEAPAVADAAPPAAAGAAPPAWAAAVGGAPRARLGALAGWAIGAFAGFVLSVAAWDFVTGLLARNSALGALAMLLGGAAVLALVLLAAQELSGFARAARIDRLREGIAAARGGPVAEARRQAAAVEALYAGRPEMRWHLDRLQAARAEVMDADAWIDLTETHLMAPLDAAARREIEAAARQVAAVTALVPLALADVAVALWANLRMVRRLSAIYGGRAGGLAGWRLMRRVVAHLAATGALALTDDLIGSVAGGGVLSKLSRRFGEGVVNGALTARVGIAAMELCRPMPFVALPAPRVATLVPRALAGLFGRSEV